MKQKNTAIAQKKTLIIITNSPPPIRRSYQHQKKNYLQNFSSRQKSIFTF